MEKSTTPESSASTRSSARTKTRERTRRRASSSQGSPDPRVGTRSVNTLSDAQLARKRANDREAQRINRQRTREHIENLERQVAELGKQKGHLHKVMQHNSDLEAQIAVLQRQLTDMALLLQYRQNPSVHTFSDADPAYGSNGLNEPNGFSGPSSHRYEPLTAVDSRPMYPAYDLQMPAHGPISVPYESSSSAVLSIASTSFTNEDDAASVTKKYIVQPSSSAPLMQGYSHQGHPITSMAMPGHQYHYPVPYSAEPRNPNRPG